MMPCGCSEYPRAADTDPLPHRCLENILRGKLASQVPLVSLRRESIFPWAYIHFCTHQQVCYIRANDLVCVSANFIFPSIGRFSYAVLYLSLFFSSSTTYFAALNRNLLRLLLDHHEDAAPQNVVLLLLTHSGALREVRVSKLLGSGSDRRCPYTFSDHRSVVARWKHAQLAYLTMITRC